MKLFTSLVRFVISAILMCVLSIGSTYLTIQYLNHKDQASAIALPIGSAQPVWKPMEPMQDTDVLSTEDLSALKSKMTAEDKQTLYDLFTNKIAPEQINAISKLFENGINQIEVDAMKAELNKHLTDKEMEKIVEIFRKYTS
ncbi:MAG: hypothetical protein RLZZ267_847 [Bacillota bacterium]